MILSIFNLLNTQSIRNNTYTYGTILYSTCSTYAAYSTYSTLSQYTHQRTHSIDDKRTHSSCSTYAAHSTYSTLRQYTHTMQDVMYIEHLYSKVSYLTEQYLYL
jgi:hypothetical protein